jgi:hypothetical protein
VADAAIAPRPNVMLSLYGMHVPVAVLNYGLLMPFLAARSLSVMCSLLGSKLHVE